MNTHQATHETALERFERRMAERDARMAERDSALVDRIATATDRMASSRWWQTAILLAGIGIFMGVATTAIIYHCLARPAARAVERARRRRTISSPSVSPCWRNA